eukprot:4326023-Amphidinium_carterae.1
MFSPPLTLDISAELASTVPFGDCPCTLQRCEAMLGGSLGPSVSLPWRLTLGLAYVCPHVFAQGA